MDERERLTNWEDCLIHKTARKINKDIPRSRFLKRTATERTNFLQNLEITEEGINFIFEGYYTSIIELIQAITLLDGYNIINHICLGYYLRDILKEENLFRIFNGLRYKRNSIIYYGKLMKFEIADLSTKQAKTLIKKLKYIILSKQNFQETPLTK